MEYALSNDYLEVGLWVLDGNSQAMSFYEKMGLFIMVILFHV